MMYFLVVGVLALSCSFILGWGLWRLTCWGLAWVWPQRLDSSKRKPKPVNTNVDKAKAEKISVSKEKIAKARPRKPTEGREKMTKSAEPGRLMQQLVLLSDLLPLGILAVLLYGGARLVAYGMANVEQRIPAGFYQLVAVLGWASVALLVLSIVGYWAIWRCRVLSR